MNIHLHPGGTQEGQFNKIYKQIKQSNGQLEKKVTWSQTALAYFKSSSHGHSDQKFSKSSYKNNASESDLLVYKIIEIKTNASKLTYKPIGALIQIFKVYTLSLMLYFESHGHSWAYFQFATV